MVAFSRTGKSINKAPDSGKFCKLILLNSGKSMKCMADSKENKH